MISKTIRTSLKQFNKDLGYEKINYKIKQLKKERDKKISVIYAFIDVNKEFVPNGVLYVGQSGSVKNRMLFYKKQASELLNKLQKRHNLWSVYWGIEHEDDYGGTIVEGPSVSEQLEIDKLSEFINDKDRCKLIIKFRDINESSDERKKIEKLYIKRYLPYLNKMPWKPYQPSRRRFYMNQMHLNPKLRSKLPVCCNITGSVLDNPTEEYVKDFNS